MLMYQWNIWQVVVFYLWTSFTILSFTGFAVMMLKVIWKVIRNKSYALLNKQILYACLALLSAVLNPLSILMVRESIAVFTWNNKTLSRLFDLWMVLQCIFFLGLVCLLLITIWLVVVKQLPGFLPITTLLVCSIVVMTFLNPLSNFLLFDPATQSAKDDMWESLKANDIVGESSEKIFQLYGKPRRIGKGRRYETWYYYPGPWYAVKWTSILINVQDDKVVEYFWDD